MFITSNGGTAGNLTNSSGTNGDGVTSPGYGVEKKVAASVDPTGYSEIRDTLSDAGGLVKGAWGFAKDLWGAFSGKNNYRAPEKVFDPYSTYDSSDSLQARAAAANQYNALTGQGGPNAYYQGLMAGTQPSLAQYQMQQGIAQAQRTGMASAAGANGVNRAAAFRNAQNNAADLSARGAVAGGQQRLQEQQLGAQGYSQGIQAASNMATTGRQQDISEQQGVFGLENQAQQNLNQQYQINAGVTNANAANSQKAMGGVVQSVGTLAAAAAMSDIRSKEDIAPVTGSKKFADAGGYDGPDANAMARAMAPGVTASAPVAASPIAQALSSYGQGMQGAQNGGPMFNAQDSQNFANIGAAAAGNSGGGSGGGGGDILSSIGSMFSDESSKENFRGVHPYQFAYKDGIADQLGKEAAANAYQQTIVDAKTPRVGIMAQDMAANPEAREVVTRMPNGMLGIDGKRALGFMLASQADFNDRLSALESRRGK